MATTKANVYEMVTSRIIAELEKATFHGRNLGQELDQEHTTESARNHTVLLIRCFYSTPENMLHLNSGQIWAVTSVKVRNRSL